MSVLSNPRSKAIGGVILGIVTVVVWARAFREGSTESAWGSSLWASAPDTRGGTISLTPKDVETTEERERRMLLDKKMKELKPDVSDLKRGLVGDGRKTRGDDVRGDQREVPAGFDVSPREACMQMKLEYPEKFGKVDCMSPKYDNPDPWYKTSGLPGR